jgi:signal transduction histidine kinase
MTLRQWYRLDGWLMLVVGFAFWGYGPLLAWYFGIPLPNESVHYDEWRLTLRGIGFARVMGGALMAFGFASLAVARADAKAHRASLKLFLAAHFFLGIITWGQGQEVWVTPAAIALVNVVLFPAIGFIYYLVASNTGWQTASGSDRERRIREVAGQEERTRLAQDLHDSVKQQIYSVQANLAAVQARWGQQDATGAGEALRHARASAQSAMSEMIALLDRLREDPIESVGLVEALRRQCEALRFQTGAEVATTFGELPDAARFAPGAATAVFRIAQEALANVARHSRPTHVSLEAGIDSGANEFLLAVADDGQGFDPNNASTGTGLANMRARAEEAGARFIVASEPGRGCAVKIRVPLRDAAVERLTQHLRLALASASAMALMGWTAWMAPGTRTYLWPVLVVAGGVALIQAGRIMQVSLKN